MGIRQYYTLLLLLVTCALSAADRQIMSVVIEPIRKEMSLSDTQIGLLTGMAFGLIYLIACVPVARLADQWSCRKVVAISAGLYSLMTALCGVTQTFWQLFAARMGVGLGETGGYSPAQAIVAEIFPRRQRSLAMSALLLASPVGIAAGLAWGGWAAVHFGWRVALLGVGFLGLLLSPLVLFTATDAGSHASNARQGQSKEPLWQVLGLLWQRRTLPLMGAAATLQVVLSLGFHAWIPAFLSRSHHLSSAEIGPKLGVAIAVGTMIGPFVGGVLIERLGRKDPRWHLWFPAITAPLSALFAIGAFLAPVGYVFFLLALQAFIGALFSGAMMAILVTLAPPGARATATACLSVLVNVFGAGLGPQLIGLTSDALKPVYGEESLRVSLLLATTVVLPVIALYLAASRHYLADLKSCGETS